MMGGGGSRTHLGKELSIWSFRRGHGTLSEGVMGYVFHHPGQLEFEGYRT